MSCFAVFDQHHIRGRPHWRAKMSKEFLWHQQILRFIDHYVLNFKALNQAAIIDCIASGQMTIFP